MVQVQIEYRTCARRVTEVYRFKICGAIGPKDKLCLQEMQLSALFCDFVVIWPQDLHREAATCQLDTMISGLVRIKPSVIQSFLRETSFDKMVQGCIRLILSPNSWGYYNWMPGSMAQVQFGDIEVGDSTRQTVIHPVSLTKQETERYESIMVVTLTHIINGNFRILKWRHCAYCSSDIDNNDHGNNNDNTDNYDDSDGHHKHHSNNASNDSDHNDNKSCAIYTYIYIYVIIYVYVCMYIYIYLLTIYTLQQMIL